MSADEVISWKKWLLDRSHDPSQTLRVSVNIENETITVHGKLFEIDKQLAAVVQCLLDAKGERRSTSEMKKEYAEYILDDRLYAAIKKHLMKHKSGIGEYIVIDGRQGYRLDSKKADE